MIPNRILTTIFNSTRFKFFCSILNFDKWIHFTDGFCIACQVSFDNFYFKVNLLLYNSCFWFHSSSIAKLTSSSIFSVLFRNFLKSFISCTKALIHLFDRHQFTLNYNFSANLSFMKKLNADRLIFASDKFFNGKICWADIVVCCQIFFKAIEMELIFLWINNWNTQSIVPHWVLTAFFAGIRLKLLAVVCDYYEWIHLCELFCVDIQMSWNNRKL